MSKKADQELGTRIRSLRSQRSMTQIDLGKAIGVDQSAVSRIEDGTRSLSAGELAATSSALGVTVGTLLDEATPALLRTGESDDQAAQESLRIFSDCIDEFRGIEALSG